MITVGLFSTARSIAVSIAGSRTVVVFRFDPRGLPLLCRMPRTGSMADAILDRKLPKWWLVTVITGISKGLGASCTFLCREDVWQGKDEDEDQDRACRPVLVPTFAGRSGLGLGSLLLPLPTWTHVAKPKRLRWFVFLMEKVSTVLSVLLQARFSSVV